MSLVLVAFFSVILILAGRIIFKKWFNHMTLYCAIIGGLVFLYELKLLPYPNLSALTWFFIISAVLSFILGNLTIVSTKNLFSRTKSTFQESDITMPILADGGKALKYSILFFSFIGLFVAIHRWIVLISKFGSISEVLLNAGVVYRLNVQGEIKEFIPILPSFIYIAVFLSGIYSAYKGRFSFLSIFPIICIVLKELTYFGRGEILFSVSEFLITFFLFRHLLTTYSSKRFKFSKISAAIVITLLLVLVISAASFIRVTRGAQESFTGASRELRQLEENMIISPSVYLYLSSDVGVFSKYLELEKETTKFGQNTFRTIYYFLSKVNVVEEPSFFQKGYFIPMWTNTGTYIRELHADFGFVGVFLGSYLLGLLITWLWFKFYQDGNILVLMILVYLYLIVGFSFQMMVTRLNQWYFSQIMIILFIPLLERMARNQKVIHP
jgi:oligosaccharide repeat unit polymerase